MIFHIYRIPSHIYTHIDIYIYIFTYAHIYIYIYMCIYIHWTPGWKIHESMNYQQCLGSGSCRPLHRQRRHLHEPCQRRITALTWNVQDGYSYIIIYIYSIIFLYIFLYNSYSGLNVKWFKCQQSNWRRFRKHCREPPKQGRLWKGMCHALSLLNQ